MKAIVLKTNELIDVVRITEQISFNEFNKYYKDINNNNRYSKDELYIVNFNQWIEITQENCDTIYELESQDYLIMIANKLDDNYIIYYDIHNINIRIGTMAKNNGYYYIVLPKLK